MNTKLVLLGALCICCALIGIGSAVTLNYGAGIHTVSTPFPIKVNEISESGINSGYYWDGDSWESVTSYSSGIIDPTSAMYIVVDSSATITITPVDVMYELAPGEDHVETPMPPGTYFIGIAPRQDAGQTWISSQLTFGSFVDENPNAVKLISPSVNSGYCWETIDPNQPLEVYKGYWVMVGDGGAIKNQYWV